MKAGGRAYVTAGVLRVHAALQRPARGRQAGETYLYPSFHLLGTWLHLGVVPPSSLI